MPDAEKENKEAKIVKPATADPEFTEEDMETVTDRQEEEIEIVEEEDVDTPEEPEEEVEIVEEEEEEKEYKAKSKPELTPEEKHVLSMRAAKKRKQPKFRRQEWFRYGRVGDSWRRPRGLHSKTRRNYKYRPPKVSKGYRGPKLARGRHPSGFEEVRIHSPKDLDGLDPKKQAARIGHTVGTRKRTEIKKKADELGIRILNWGP